MKAQRSLFVLLAHGAAPNDANKKGDTPLKFAQRLKRPDIVALLRGKR